MGCEAPQIRMWFMSEPIRRRQRGTERLRESERLVRAIVTNLGNGVRSGRTRLRLTQQSLAERVDVHATRISQIESGHGDGVPLRTWVALGIALDQPLAVSFSRPVGGREPSDAGHLGMQERLLQLARAAGRTATFELPTRPADPRHSIDVCVRDGRHRVLIIQEAWNTFGDLGAAVRSTNRKAAEAAGFAATVDGGPPYRVATVWIVRPSAANRALVGRYPEIFGAAFPGSSRAWVAALANGSIPPAEPGFVWLDSANGRLTEWRRARK